MERKLQPETDTTYLGISGPTDAWENMIPQSPSLLAPNSIFVASKRDGQLFRCIIFEKKTIKIICWARQTGSKAIGKNVFQKLEPGSGYCLVY